MSKGKDLLQKALNRPVIGSSKYQVNLDYLPLCIAYVIGRIKARQFKEVIQEDSKLFDMDVGDTSISVYCIRTMRQAYYEGQLSFNYNDEIKGSEEADKVGRQSIE